MDPPVISENAFEGCNNLKSVNVPNNYEGDNFSLFPIIRQENRYEESKSATQNPNKLNPTQDPNKPNPTQDPNSTFTNNETSSPTTNNKKKSSSSHKNNEEDKELSARILGDFKIDTVYLGTSPNIVVNLNIFSSLMKKARQLFAHIIPAPDFIHSAIWVGKKDANDDSLGAIFVYGKYWNKHNLTTYIECDGAKAFAMTLGEFKQRYPSIDPIKLNIHKTMKLFEFIEKVRKSGHWTARNYNWPTNNCQHFTSKLINILKATRENPDSNDWINLPKLILSSLEMNENFLKQF